MLANKLHLSAIPKNSKAEVTSGLQKKTYRNRNFQAFTISWLPHDFAENPNLCAFNGAGARLFPERNTCATSVGRVFKLDETIRLGVNVKNAVCMWGPYEIRKGDKLFDLINRAGGITRNTYLPRAYVFRGGGDSTNIKANN